MKTLSTITVRKGKRITLQDCANDDIFDVIITDLMPGYDPVEDIQRVKSDSSIARSLLGMHIDEQTEWETPNGMSQFIIKDISNAYNDCVHAL